MSESSVATPVVGQLGELAESEEYATQLAFSPVKGHVKGLDDEKLAQCDMSDMNIGVYSVSQVHGFLDGPGTQPASLIVLKYCLGDGVKRRFKAFNPAITVHADPPTNSRDQPWVSDCVHPGTARMIVYELQGRASEQANHNTSVGVKGPEIAPLEAKYAHSKLKGEFFTKRHLYTVKASLKQDSVRAGKDDQLSWVADQSSRIEFGIDLLQVAFVVQRKADYDLKLTLNFNATVDFRYAVMSNLKKWSRVFGMPGITRERKITVYEDVKDPTTGVSVRSLRKTDPIEGVDADYLRRLDKDNRDVLERLGWAHVPEGVRPARVYVSSLEQEKPDVPAGLDAAEPEDAAAEEEEEEEEEEELEEEVELDVEIIG